jgi:hypothetical protein
MCLLALGACNEVPDACQQVADELSFPYSFASYEAAGRTLEEWRELIYDKLGASCEPNIHVNPFRCDWAFAMNLVGWRCTTLGGT